jgi:hypothetical protein
MRTRRCATAIPIIRTSTIATRISRLRGRVVLSCALALGAPHAAAAPYLPKDDGVVLERLPVRPGDPVARELRSLRAELARDPRDAGAALALAQRYFELASAEGDPRFIGYAEAALKTWWNETEPPPGLLVMRALLKQYSHDFSGALRDLAAAARADPRDAPAWSWRAAIHMVQADYAAARADCDALRGNASELRVVGCLAYLDGTTGKAAAAYRALAEALASARDASPGEKVWAQTRLAELTLRLGDPARAERHFRAALAEKLSDQFLLAAYADFLLDRGRPAEVVPLLADWTRSDILLLRLALAESTLGLPAAKDHIAALKARFDAAALRGDKLHLQEEARFNLHLLGEKDKALALAQENWKLQREPRDARVLLEAALAANHPRAAKEALDWLERSGHEDPVLREIAAKLKAVKP